MRKKVKRRIPTVDHNGRLLSELGQLKRRGGGGENHQLPNLGKGKLPNLAAKRRSQRG